MRFSDDSYNIRVELNTENCQLSPAELAEIESGLDPLRDPVKDFPVCDLYIYVMYLPRSNDYYVKTSLVLTGRTLFTGDHDAIPYPAFERCVRKLVKRVERYKASLGGESEIAKLEKGTHQDMTPTELPEPQAVNEAVANGDYAAFRKAMYAYEEPLRRRVGRWIQRYPALDEMIDERLKIEDIVEETFLNAFERYEQRPENVRFSEWLEDCMDDGIKQLLKHPGEELENISFARTIQEVETGSE